MISGMSNQRMGEGERDVEAIHTHILSELRVQKLDSGESGI